MKSLGYVECNGLSGAIVAADRMLKTADVELKSIQNTKGNGWITLQIIGELSAITVAIQAVKESLPSIYVTSVVIGRPAKGLGQLGKNDVLKRKTTGETKKNLDERHVEKNGNPASISQPEPQNSKVQEESVNEKLTATNSKEATCNLCGDPKCPRKLGEPHKKCIHYNEVKKK